ncbi:MAG TPA: PaaI family thioesterase [Verrucomicrobiae bacterium]|nr:PaaI family thioesterase [Verrucomicrobiae bacterium]
MSADAGAPVPDLQAICDGSQLHRALRVRVARAPAGVSVRAELDARWANDDRGTTVHGGAVATLLDTTLTFALLAATGDDWATADLRVDYLRPVPVGPVELSGEVLRAGRMLGRARATLVGADGRPHAIAIGSCARLGPLAVDPPTPDAEEPA